MKKPLILMILDGWGYREEIKDNGILQANTPHFSNYLKKYPYTLIEASGPAVGLPVGVMGNSEVGHMNIGSGRIIFTGLSQIYQAIENQSFFSNPALMQAVQAAKKNNSALHLMGLLSDGAVHSHQDHLYALLKLAKKEGLQKVFVHCFMDGRDTAPQDGKLYLEQLEQKIKEIGVGKIASVSGRFFAMDRDKRWERIERAYDAMLGVSVHRAESAAQVIEGCYSKNVFDEFVDPYVIVDSQDRPVGPVLDNDAIIFYNFRADRAREISTAFTQKDFSKDLGFFDRKGFPGLSAYICMSQYDEKLNLPVAFLSQKPKKVLAEILGEKGLTQLRISETEKYAHVTFFFNGGQEPVFPGEERVLIPSPKEVPTYDLKPEMSAGLVTNALLQKIEEDRFDVIILNFANTDMVGHTAVPEAIIKAVETVDTCMGKIVDKILEKGGTALITADHGNAEVMKDANGNPMTSHTLNPVPFIVVSNKEKNIQLTDGGRLCDVAPTMLKILKIDQPIEMTGRSLIN